ncbi:hypothetical protein HELRODRAFT_165820 [Helobdella robusta]|uniref:Uncharacterized protein n=1 Tax=Helobdella robusta TaxID=6412 RepID=T1EXB8_HELRO|nr:hypothetical protein HELRODRAFT_165820 [Helobdella robusta]ESN91751.1 hypothetical protein HELRODRAFT_165820 [Helobdella robusta]
MNISYVHASEVTSQAFASGLLALLNKRRFDLICFETGNPATTSHMSHLQLSFPYGYISKQTSIDSHVGTWRQPYRIVAGSGRVVKITLVFFGGNSKKKAVNKKDGDDDDDGEHGNDSEDENDDDDGNYNSRGKKHSHKFKHKEDDNDGGFDDVTDDVGNASREESVCYEVGSVWRGGGDVEDGDGGAGDAADSTRININNNNNYNNINNINNYNINNYNYNINNYNKTMTLCTSKQHEHKVLYASEDGGNDVIVQMIDGTYLRKLPNFMLHYEASSLQITCQQQKPDVIVSILASLHCHIIA